MLKYKYSVYTKILATLIFLFGSGHKFIGNINRELGNICRKQGYWKEAFEYFDEALSIYKIHCPMSSEMSKLLVAIGNLAWEKNELENAYGYYLKAKAIDEKLGNKEGVARDLGNLGLIKKEQSEYPESYNLFMLAKTMFGQACGVTSDKVALVYMNLSQVLIKLDRVDEALDYAISASHIFKNYYSNNLNQIAVCHDAIGACYFEKGNFKKALEYHGKALKIFRDIYKEEHVMIANNYLLTGKSKAALVSIDEAKECYNRSMHIYRLIAKKNGGNFEPIFAEIQDYLTKLKGE